MAIELNFILDELMPQPHIYGNFNENLDFVSFSQGSIQSTELCTIDFFNVSFLTKNGHLYILSPVLLQNMVLREDHFSNIMVLLSDMVSDLAEEGKE